MNRKHAAPTCVLLILVALAHPLAAAPANDPWFDLENCAMCKNMTAEKNLMENMSWENHLTRDGMMSVTIVNPGYEEALERSLRNMQVAVEKLKAGEQVYLCGFCQSYGALQDSGASMEHIRTKAGTVELVTSHDPEIIRKIHIHGQRTIDEYQKMMAAEVKTGHSHDHH